ncbi:AAA domain-containing protein [Pseudarcicella hirudinis]|uniref:AAA domain-containing protein n=2 Tax=Pseudarcicella hirudinis TaxID=1079859 RepID=A0A1I5QPL4_9BACT|nr:AAA domain-containing protein [Pseudarcicella hirudinis]SFP47806.1 AAA domain-containing protein [Pseudarcicella hirudinis]
MLKKILKSYQKRLTNLSSRNKSLLLLTLSSEQFLDVHELDFLQNTPSFELVEQLLAQKNTIQLCDVLDPRFEKVNEVSKRLRKISRTEKFIEEERGSEDLYIGYPFIKGKLLDGTLVRCPLLFFPVTLAQKSQKTNQWILQRRDEPVSLNRSFLLAYSHFNQVKISDAFLEQSFEDFPKNSLEFRTALYEFLKASPLEINFNQELFTNQLTHFEKSTRADLELSEKNGALKLFPQAVLGIFPQAGSFLVDDYELLIENLDNAPDISEEDLFSKFGIEKEELNLREESLITPFQIDASQENALKNVKQGNSLVIQGPPGTGKSQLICNLVADFTARGKKVLVVSQKRAALDVVYDRLAKTGMQDFVANIHDFKNDRKALYDKLFNQIEKIDEFQRQNQSLDAILLERNFTQESRTIDRVSTELQAFKEALFDEKIAGISAKELYLTSSPEEPSLNLKEHFKYFKINEIHDFLNQCSSYLDYHKKMKCEDEKTEHFWQSRLDFRHFQFPDLQQIEKAISGMSHFSVKIAQKTRELLGESLNFEELLGIFYERVELNSIVQTLENEHIYRFFQKGLNQNFQPVSIDKISALKTEVFCFFEGQGIEVTASSQELNIISQKLSEAVSSKANPLSGLIWQVFSKEKDVVQALAGANGLGTSREDLNKLSQRINNRINLEKWWNQWGDLFGNQPDEKSEPVWLRKGLRWFERHFYNLEQATKAHKIADDLVFFPVKNATGNDLQNFQKIITELIQLSTEGFENQQTWLKYLTEIQLEQIDRQEILIDSVVAELKKKFELFCEADQLKATFSRLEWDVIILILEENPKGKTEVEEDIKLLLNSLKLSWIEHLEELYPILRAVSSLKISQLENQLQTSVQAKQQLSQEILLLKLREQTFRELELNRLQNVVTYRELKHQVSKKRNVWAIRKLIAEFSEEIFKLIPCWLASPETVSAVFPLQTISGEQMNNDFLFDLVIFDEASQCFAEQGIPALFRGRQVVIAGDSKQLKPNDLYAVRFEEDSEDLPELEVDSLLDLAAQYLSQNQLKSHYRSKSLDLIDFSNQYFYKRTLQLLPDFKEINKNEPAIKYLKVDGIWENNANVIEGQSVVELVRNLKETSPEKSIGIVTFNTRQQALIQDLLEEIPNIRTKEHEPLFIKNIENVQGDERDIIIFSIGYASDVRGKFSMQFGSLNAMGGENRLNVAVTRAREKIFIVSSILPNQLTVEDLQNEGPKLLKKYLEYAWQVSIGQYQPKPFEARNYKADWFLKEQLRRTNARFVKELPFADLTVKNTSNYESLILTDDDLYFESISSKEVHAYHPLSLKRKGWDFRRVYSREFWLNNLTDLQKSSDNSKDSYSSAL